jgi:hypothetical protein
MEYNATAFVGCDNQAVSTILEFDLTSLILFCNVFQVACLHENGTETNLIVSIVFNRIVPVVGRIVSD